MSNYKIKDMKKTILATLVVVVLSSCYYNGQPGAYINASKSYGPTTGNAGMSGKLYANGFLPEDSAQMAMTHLDSSAILTQAPTKK